MPVQSEQVVSSTLALEEAPHQATERPRLIFFYSASSGRCRRAEGFLAQVLQRRRNHEAFTLVRVSVEQQPELAARFRVDALPTILVVEERKVKRRIISVSGCRELQAALEPWLR